MGRLRHSVCPVCGGSPVTPSLTVMDRTVLKEPFEIWHCPTCHCRFTQDGPDAADIGAAYDSADYISHSNTQAGLVNRLYHLVRPFSLRGKRRLVRRLSGLGTGSLLDVGSGRGHFLGVMQAGGWSVKGIEADRNAREAASAEWGVEVQEPPAMQQLPPETFQVITLWHVLEHLHALHGNMDTFGRLLTPDGTLIIAVPNHLSDDARHYGEHWAAWDVPRHLYHFTAESIGILASRHGFEITSMRGMWLDPFYVSLLSERNRHG
ncbi:MAG: class I SAM-dependent methyltransferase, partial [Candidatus Marinimicrobia bacterium]|nr:class I SAM-dependent methyltransferase [Candidatus Neomarinimicrobiota bacterium]